MGKKPERTGSFWGLQEQGLHVPFPWNGLPAAPSHPLAGPLTETHSDPELLWQNQKLESLGLLAGGVAHDFNNYLLAILGNVDLMAQDLSADAPHTHFLGEIRTAASRASDLCNQLLAFAGKGQFRIQPLDLSQTVGGMSGMLKVALSNKISLHLELSQEMPPIAGDSAQIHQVVMNLAINAAEAIGEGAGTVSLRTGVWEASSTQVAHWVLAPYSTTGSFVYLAVVDTGSGMDTATIARAFDPFFSSKPQGRGLGLASVLGIMRSHGGAIGIDSVPGQGTTVTVLIPFQPVTAESVQRERVSISQRTGGTILVVDDEKYLRLLSKRMLSRLGYTVYVADGGPAALELCQTLEPSLDCVLLDLIMPGMDGAEVHAELRRLYPDLKVLLTSGYHEAEVSRRFAGHGLAGFLQKPYVMEDLAKKINEVLNQPTEGPSAVD